MWTELATTAMRVSAQMGDRIWIRSDVVPLARASGVATKMCHREDGAEQLDEVRNVFHWSSSKVAELIWKSISSKYACFHRTPLPCPP